MLKKLLFLSVIVTLNFTSCQNDDGQNLDINVTGKVTNQNNTGVGDVAIYIYRGDINYNYGPTHYHIYDTIKTNSSGDYQYLVKYDSYSYKICCGVPAGYTSVDEFCKFVNHNIKNSQTVPNIVNFKLTK